jgi:hypothetical protein
MPAEIFSRTGTEVAERVKRQFGDPDGRQITDYDILLWINTSKQDIISQNPILKDSAATNVVANQDLYTYPSERVQYIEALHYEGVPLQYYSFQEAQAYILSTIPEGEQIEAVKPQIWYERAGDIYLYPKPKENITNGLRMFFVKQPEDLAQLSDTLSVPDRYFQRVIDLVLARAYQLDENWEAAQYKQQEYVNAMGLLANQENVIQTNTYPTNTPRIEDL